MKKLIAGNWKMNMNLAQSIDLAEAIAAFPKDKIAKSEFLICPPSLYIAPLKDICARAGIALGAQDCAHHNFGAYTGEIAASMIKDCGGTYVILGHSERRQYHGESNALIAQKAKAAHIAGLIAIICVGETEAQRLAGEQERVIATQISDSLPATTTAQNTVIAYEPVWAIGTGKTAGCDDVAAMHGFIRTKLKERLAHSENLRILYGGSMNPENARVLLSTPNVDGGLIGGASLKSEQFIEIALAASSV